MFTFWVILHQKVFINESVGGQYSAELGYNWLISLCLSGGCADAQCW